ncbi:hypothetical protein FHW74_004105 [Atlantibacter sp. RC6]|nr:hypothetical protein [Atlantibacter sp. RC6]
MIGPTKMTVVYKGPIKDDQPTEGQVVDILETSG